MIPTLLKQRMRQNQHFRRLAHKSLNLCRENTLDQCNENKFTKKDGSVSTKCGWSSHYQAFTRFSPSVHSHFDSILNKDQLKCISHETFKQLSVLLYCLISRMFSAEDSSCEEISIYVNLFLLPCIAFCKTVNKWNKEEKDRSRYEENTFSSSTTNFFSQLSMPEMVRLHGSVKEI